MVRVVGSNGLYSLTMMMMAFIGTSNSNPHSHLSNRRILSHTHYVPARSALLKGTAPREQSGGLGRRNKEEKKKKKDKLREQ